MIRFENPEALALLLVVPLLWLLARVRGRVRRVALAPFPWLEAELRAERRPPPRVLRLGRRQRFLLTAAALSSLGLAAAGPTWVEAVPRADAWFLVVDNTVHATALSGGRPAWDALVAAAERWARGLPADSPLVVLTTGPEPRVHRMPAGELPRWLAGLAPRGAPPAEPLAAGFGEFLAAEGARPGLVFTVRPGAWAGRVPAEMPVPRGRPLGPNAGIVGFDLGRSRAVEGAFDVEVRVGGSPRPLVLEAGGRTVRRGEPGPDGRWAAEGVALPPGEVAVRLEGADPFPADDAVAAEVRPPRAFAVAFRHDPVPLVEAAVRAVPGVTVAGDAGGADVEVVFRDPPEAFERPTLVVRPERAFAGFRYQGLAEEPGAVGFRPGSPLGRDVDFWNFRPRRALRFEAPGWARAEAWAGDVPVLWTGETGGHRVAVWNFDPAESGAGADPSFPILTRNTLEWLAGAEPAVWDADPTCEGGAWPGRPPRNLLCRRVTAEASALEVPDPEAVPPPEPGPPQERRTPLGAPFLAAGFLCLLWLTLAGAAGPPP